MPLGATLAAATEGFPEVVVAATLAVLTAVFPELHTEAASLVAVGTEAVGTVRKLVHQFHFRSQDHPRCRIMSA